MAVIAIMVVIAIQARELISSLLQHDPARRPDAEALLQHPWIQGTGVSAAPIPDAASNLLEFQRAKRKLRTALVASMHQQARACYAVPQQGLMRCRNRGPVWAGLQP